MFCPNCGQERTSTETSFCSRCGFLLTGTADLLRTGGIIPQSQDGAVSKRQSPRKRGLKQGLFIFLLTFLVVPILALLTIALRVQEPFVVAFAAVLLTMGGLLRMAYAMMFEEADPPKQKMTDDFLSAAQSHMNRPPRALSGKESIPASAYAAPLAGNWRDTNDLQPTSVVEGTTKLLEETELK